MLGLGTSITNVDSANIYKELSELANYADLDVHFDFSTLTGAHGDEVESAQNLGAAGAGKNIDSNEGTPSLDTTTMSRNTVAFDGNDDVLDMAASYTTTGKSMTFFLVFQRNDVTNDYTIAGADNRSDNWIRFTSSGQQIQSAMQGQDSVSSVMNNTDNSSISYAMVADTPTVYVLRRSSNGSLYHYMDNGLFVSQKTNAAAKEATNFVFGAVGGTTEGSKADFTGVIGEVGIYDDDITEANAIILAKELSTKWGVNRRS